MKLKFGEQTEYMPLQLINIGMLSNVVYKFECLIEVPIR